MKESIKALCEAWYEAGSVVFITGAGASTESGLADFTGEGSTYGGASVKEILSRDFMLSNPEIFNSYCRERLYAPYSRPNNFHKALAVWEETGLVTAIVTQNIDTLHQMAGSQNVVELHGNMQRVFCDSCKRGATAQQMYGQAARVNKCPFCGGTIRPTILLYGEKIDKNVYASAVNYVERVPMLIIAGTRLKVTGPRDIIENFRSRPGVLAYIGLTPPEDFEVDIFVEGKIGEVTTELIKRMI